MIRFNHMTKKCQVVKDIIHYGVEIPSASRLVHLDENTDKILYEMKSNIIDPRSYIEGTLASTNECLILGYGYGTGEEKSPSRSTDLYDDVIFIRPWNAGDAVYQYRLNEVLYHNTWKHVEFTVPVSEHFRLYLKYGNGDGACYVKNIKINNEEYPGYPDTNSEFIDKDGIQVVKLPNDWSKVFLIENNVQLDDGEYTISFDYYVETDTEYADLPDPPRSVYGEITVEELDTTNEAWMHNLPFESAEKMQEAYEMGEAAYLRTLPDDNKRLTEQITALEMAIVDLYEGGNA